MAILQFDEYKSKLLALKPTLADLAEALGLESAHQELDLLQAESAADGFWNDMDHAQKITTRIKNLQDKIDDHKKREAGLEDLLTLCEMGQEMEDESLVPEVEEGYEHLVQDLEKARLATLFTGEYDHLNCMLTIHAGAGGTEAQDWASMLFRMYTRWAERQGFKWETLDYEDGDEAGIKSATIMVTGENAYGYLQGENGVHRLVRVSPFDANARRQTSFAAVEVMPDIARRRGGGDPPRGHRDAGVPLLRRRRPAHQQDLLRRPPDPQAHRHRGVQPAASAASSRTRTPAMRMLRAKLVELQDAGSMRRRSPTSRACR